ncbi:MAG: hypothetical protein WAK20_17750 [Candidatus Acidiferrum sp.]
MAKQTKAHLEQEVQELRQRVETLERMLATLAAARPDGATAGIVTGKESVREGIAPEVVLAITAAVAAFLGKRATIHQIRLTGTTAWAMQGRATVQASHGISRWSR